jgi:SulP family sulfate permease
VRAGARSPVAGMMHAVFLLVFMLVLAPLMRWVPLPALAAVLLVVAWNMSEIERFRHLMKAPVGDRVVLLATFGLTVMFDLTVAIQVGVLLAAFQFMHRMSEVVALDRDVSLVDEDQDDLAGDRQPDMRDVLPSGVAAFRISGPLFFAVANRLDNVLDQFADPPRAFILRLRLVPLIDASGAQALESFLDRCHRLKIRVLLSGIQPQPSRVLRDMGISAHPAVAGMARDFEAALILARQLVA